MNKKYNKLVLTNIEKSFWSGDKKISVLDGLNLDVSIGELISIKGESGVGKTTLLHIIGSIEDADKGSIVLDGRGVYRLNNKELNDFRNRTIGFIFQFFHLLPEFTALENVIFPLLIAGNSRTDALEKSRQLLIKVGLGDRLEHYPSQLSGGEQQRVAIARALVNSPRLLLADEPTGNLDPKTGKEVFNLIKALHCSDDRITIVATHNAEIAAMCDKIYLLKKGKLLKQST